MESVATVVRISAHENGGSAVGGGNTLDSMGGGGASRLLLGSQRMRTEEVLLAVEIL